MELPYNINEIFSSNSVWLLEAINTKEASRISSIPEPTLITMRSRGGGADFFTPEGTRLVRYFRYSIYRWLLSDGLKSSTSAPGIPLKFFQNYEEKNQIGPVILPTDKGSYPYDQD